MLQSSISEVFTTMFKMVVQPSALADFRRNNEELVAGSVGFVGDVNGMVYLYVKAPLARILASRMLGIAEAEIEGDDVVNDVIGEMSNMVVGAVKSRLCDTGAVCKLTIPSIVRGINLSAAPTGASDCRLMSCACENETLLVEILMTPSAQT